jgi:hypothetical protein
VKSWSEASRDEKAARERKRQLREVLNRSNAYLQPIIDAEIARGNVVIRPWSDAHDRQAVYSEARMLYPLDTEAILEQFDFGFGVGVNTGGSVTGGPTQSVIAGGDKKPSNRVRTANELWWQQWRAGPQTKIRIEAPADPDRSEGSG